MLELPLSTKFIILTLILLAAGLYYVYNSTQKFKTTIVNLLNNMQSEHHTEEYEQKGEQQGETEPKSENAPEE